MGADQVTESSTLTVMFTDMVNSTERMNARGEESGASVRHKLFELMRGATAAAGGTEVKNLGDGLMITFPTVRAGLNAAVLMQRRAARHNQRQHDAGIHLRIGLSVGDATSEDGDWHGASVTEAKRLCDEAEGDQVLVTEKIQLLADPGGPPLSPVGARELKGLGDAFVYQVDWDRVSADERGRSLPRRLEIARAADFVARGHEFECLLEVLDRANAGTRQVALICGEPGIGKTTLAAEAAGAAGARGARVLYGRNEEGIGVPFQPFVETLGDLVAQAAPALLRSHVAEHGGELRRLVPALAARVPDVPAARASDPPSERYQLFAAVVDLLGRSTEDEVVFLVFDDLHWADRPTIDLLRFILSRLDDAALALVATYRDSDLGEGHPLGALFEDLDRRSGDRRTDVTRLRLTGFDEGDVMALIERAGQGFERSGEALARTLQQETAGNPFFIRELLHSIEEEGGPPDDGGGWGDGDRSLPHGVREVILRRVGRLGEPTSRVLGTAAVVGREFDLELLRRAVDADDDELAVRLNDAVQASLLTELPGAAGRFVFPHALVPYALYEDLGPARRHRAHARVAAALESLCGSRPGARITELARHWGKTTSVDDLPKAVRYSSGAGEHALGQLAPSEAARWYEQALKLHDRRPDGDSETRCEILICLGKAEALAGIPKYRETLFTAFEEARALDDGPRAVRAALANGRGVYSSPGQVDRERVKVLEHALAAVGEQDSPERAEVLARMADELAFARESERVRALSGEALAIARRIDEPRALIDVVSERAIAIWSPDTLAARREEAEEAVRAADRVGDPLPRFRAYRCRAYASICAGELGRAETDHAAALALADRTAHPMARWMARVIGSTIATIRGHYAEAEGLAGEAFDIAMHSGEEDAPLVYFGQLGQIRFEQGRLAELRQVIVDSAKQFPHVPSAGILAATAAEAGLVDDALAELARGADAGFAALDITWAGVIGPHAIACARVEDRHTSGLLRALLEPYAGQVAYTAANAWLTVDHHLGALARVDGLYDEAEKHLGRAAEMARHMDAPVWRARAQLEQARTRIARGSQPADVVPLLEEAREAAAKHGAAGVERDATALIQEPERAVTA